MKNYIFYTFIILLFLNSCTKDESNSPNDTIIGKWKLQSIVQRKDGNISTLQSGGANFDFTTTEVSIDNDTYLHKSGNFNYAIVNENYFNPTLEEPKNTVLKIDGQKYVIEIDYTATTLIMTNYSDGRIIYQLTK
jgi:hypothetical protein